MGQPSSSHPTTKDGFSVTNVLEEPLDVPPHSAQLSCRPPTAGDRVVYLSGDTPKYGVFVRAFVLDRARMAEVKFYNPMTQDGKHGHLHSVSYNNITRVHKSHSNVSTKTDTFCITLKGNHVITERWRFIMKTILGCFGPFSIMFTFPYQIFGVLL